MSMLVDLTWFAAELAVYGSLLAWGLTRSTWPRKLLSTVGSLAVFITIWGTFCAPLAPYPLHGLARLALETAWFAGGALAAFKLLHRPTCTRLATRRRPRSSAS